jgi:hypothetical protein
MQYSPYHLAFEVRTLFHTTLLLLLTSCNAYEPGQLEGGAACGNGRVDPGETCDIAIPAGDGACPDECTSTATCVTGMRAGSGCQQRCVMQTVTKAHNGDGCCPKGLAGADDKDCATCGDGVVGPGETCDPPDECITSDKCVAPAPCITATLRGDDDDCNTRCELTPITACRSGDRCCPEGCGQDSDEDCSASCGDGVVDARVETCEPQSESQACEANCDDEDACTQDFTTGSADNCNVSCSHTPITSPRDGDGCCPKAGNALNDEDCKPRCGNGVREAGEDCDGEPDCSRRCTLAARDECRKELAKVDVYSDACKACACERCSSVVLNCRSSGDRAANAACRAVTECARRTGCASGSCYCGTSANCAFPNGACYEELELAAGSTLPFQVFACAGSPNCPAGRAYVQESCLERNCAKACAIESDEER